MLLSSKNRLKFIVAIIFVNLSMLWLIYLSISLSIEKNNSFDGIVGVFIGCSLLILLARLSRLIMMLFQLLI